MSLSIAQAALLGLLQGVTELFPISSLGHSVLVPHLLGWQVDLSDPQFVAFVVATHLATALVLFFFFWSDWVRIIQGLFRSLGARAIPSSDAYARLAWLIVVSTIPAGLLGLVLQKKIESLFGASVIVALALILNGIVLYAAEYLRKRAPEGKGDDSRLARLTWTQACFIGLLQCFALIPGFSRTGFAMTGGLASGLSHENAARYSFLLATPIILAAALLKIPSLFHGALLTQSLVGAVCAAIAAYVSVRFLTKYFETKTLTPFAVYCAAAGAIALFALAY